MRIGIVAPSVRIDRDLADRVSRLASGLFPETPLELWFHPQCFLACGHFAGDDGQRAQAFLDVANDPGFDALWFARGGYGCGRLAERVIPALGAAARQKTYLGYSDAGFLLAALYGAGIGRVAHGPMPADLNRDGGAAAVRRALAFLVTGAAESLEASLSPEVPAVAFNITILSHLIGTPWQPDLGGHLLLLEEVSEYMYRIDRALCHLTSIPAMRRLAGLRLGRCSLIPPNDPDFGQSEDDVAKFWCQRSGIPYLGRADIGHDSANKVVPFGRWRRGAA